jgi:hypothetical protein
MDSSCAGRSEFVLMRKERQPAFRTIEGWARLVLREAGAIREYEQHGWAKDGADPHARERAILFARQRSAARCLSRGGGSRRRGRSLFDRRYLPRSLPA